MIWIWTRAVSMWQLLTMGRVRQPPEEYAGADDDASLALGPILDFMRKLWALNHALERASMRMEAELGITAQQRVILRIIGKFPGVAPGRLARVLHVDAGTVSAAVRRLEGRKLVARTRDEVDGRRVSLRLTSAGRRLDRPTPRTVETAVETVMAVSSQRDVETVRRLLDRLVDALTA